MDKIFCLLIAFLISAHSAAQTFNATFNEGANTDGYTIYLINDEGIPTSVATGASSPIQFTIPDTTHSAFLLVAHNARGTAMSELFYWSQPITGPFDIIVPPDRPVIINIVRAE